MSDDDDDDDDDDAADFEALSRENAAMRAELEHLNSELEQGAHSLYLQTSRFEATIESSRLAFYMFDRHERLVVSNQKLKTLLHLGDSELQSKLSITDFSDRIVASLGPLAAGHARIEAFGVVSKSRGKAALNLVFASGQVLQVTHTPMRDGGFIQTMEDVTDRRKAEAKANHLASHDALTNLPNRRLLKQHIYVALNDNVASCAVLCVAVDRFKAVNDSLGHAGGDALLVSIARRLSQCIRGADVVSRLGGHEFAILLASAKAPSEAVALAERVIEEMSRPFDVMGHSVIVGANIGIALGPKDGDDADQLIRRADLSLFEARRAGSGMYRQFETGIETKAEARLALEADLRKAVREKQFELHYQPVFAARDRQLLGFEALLRWNHPVRGRVSPLDFIPAAEELGLITELGDWIIQDACRTAASWPGECFVAVNVSARQFINHDLHAVVNAALAASGLAASRLELEITESTIMENGDEIAAVLHRFREQGIGVAMDDFGTGYSSLAYLRRFHFSKVKIDRSFVSGLETEPQSIAIVRAIMALCQSLGLAVTAEGVETEAQAEILRLENCDFLQGFLLGRPTPSDQLSSTFQAAASGRVD